jgi:hypothetical protein
MGTIGLVRFGEKAMSNEEESRRRRADSLRQRIAEREKQSGPVEEHPEMLPGESPNEYVERRMRELDKKKRKSGPPDTP